MILMLLTFMFLMSIYIMILEHPLSMGFTLMIQTIITCLMTGYFNSNYWYSYILFLIMIGGMLILFIYMTSIASNEKFKPSLKTLLMSILILIILSIMYINIDYFYFMLNNTYEYKEFSWTINKYFNYPNIFISLFLMIYLLITLIASVKITDLTKGPLRSSY